MALKVAVQASGGDYFTLFTIELQADLGGGGGEALYGIGNGVLVARKAEVVQVGKHETEATGRAGGVKVTQDRL